MELGAARSFFSKDPALPCTGAGLICALPDKERGLAQPVLSLLDKELKVPRSPPRGAARVYGGRNTATVHVHCVSLAVGLLE